MQEQTTETQLKLSDAGTQMKLALAHATEDDVFRSCVNAFIASARSVTMVMERESATNPELRVWYKTQMATLGQEPLFKFFNHQRIYTIHRGVVQPERGSFPVTKMEWARKYDPARGIWSSGRFTAPGEEPPAEVGDVIIAGPDFAITWSIPEAKQFMPESSANLFKLCEDYFVQLKGFVHAWLARRRELLP